MLKTAILSDIGNVVVFFDNRLTCRALAAVSRCDEAEINRRLFSGPDRLVQGYLSGEMDSDTFRQSVMQALDCLDSFTAEQFDAAFARVFTPNDEVVGLWRRLHRRGLTIVAVSDVEELRHRELERLGLMPLFSDTVLSYREKIVKPSLRLIELGLERAGAHPAEAVYIDDLAVNLEPAERLGVSTHLYVDFAGLVEFLRQQGIPVS